ncbi:MAG: PEP-CTERM sorting domain-containing protein [Planctomycetaceae bacterium]|nr:PEP-CTERM sorting domain-containing protein [Planctomycetaceae bacterium]
MVFNFKRLSVVCATVGLVAVLAGSLTAQVVGPGPFLVDEPGANNAVDTPTNGDNDQSRQNVDISYNTLLQPGTYSGSVWSYRAGQTGSVIPYLAISNGDHSYEIVAVGDQVDIDDAGLDQNVTLPFGGDSFVLDTAKEVFGGIVNPTGIGEQNPIYTNLNSGGLMDHDNNNDGNLSPAVVGGTVDGLGHTNLPRSYAFSINIVPEPSSILLVVLSGLCLLPLRRRRR